MYFYQYIIYDKIGKPKFFNHEYVKDGAVVLDVGINRDENNKLCGDVDFDDVKDKVSAITPVLMNRLSRYTIPSR